MSTMKGFRDSQKRKRLKEKKKDDSLRFECDKQFPDCPTEPNISDCKVCPFWTKDMDKGNDFRGNE